MAANSAAVQRSAITAVLRVTSGRFQEMYYFFLFGLQSILITTSVFPGDSGFAGLMLTLGSMASGASLIAFVPGHARIGLLAPDSVLLGRLQGLSAGVASGG